MSTYLSTVIKTGNSYALRVPKQYIEDAKLQLGDKANLALPIHDEPKQDIEKIKALWLELQALKPFQSIKDPAAWQREIRKERPLPGRD